MALYMINFTSRGIVIAFFAALFPQLARNTPHSRELRVRHEQGELSSEAYEKEKGIERSKISSIGVVRLELEGSLVFYSIFDDTIVVDLAIPSSWRCCCIVTQLIIVASPERPSES
jgi:hypothetical protein